MKLRVLVACEESQTVTKEFRRLGHEAWSCDLMPCSGGHPEWHIRDDVRNVLYDKWDIILAFPPCTYLTVAGNAYFNEKKYGEKAVFRKKLRQEAIDFFMAFVKAPCAHIAIENPVGIMSTVWRKPDQIIQPYQFGDPYEKRTCLWLIGLPPLLPVEIVSVPPRRVFKSGKTMASWYADAWNLSPQERFIFRSKTFPGVAKAMAEQWSGYVIKCKYKSTY